MCLRAKFPFAEQDPSSGNIPYNCLWRVSQAGEYITDCPNVIECNCVTGDYSMLMEVVFHTTSELDQFIGQLQHFGRTKTQIVFSTSVEHRGIPLGDTRIPILEQEEEKG